MSFEKIQLPPFMLSDLYPDNLVLIENELKTEKNPGKAKTGKAADPGTPVTAKEAVQNIAGTGKPLSWLGNNNRNISIVVNDEQAIHLQDELVDILSAILSACKLNLADVAIVNISTQPVTDTLIRQELSPRVVLLFGVETTAVDLPFSIPMYKTQDFNHCTYLQVAALEKMSGHSNEAKLEKSRLWVCLKTIFGI
jgi:hypothetical protein